jgi:RNA recognition motif-containing protein
MSKSVYVGNLPFTSSEEEISDLFSQFGEVSSVKIILDRETGRSRGFAFVAMENGTDEAIQELNGKDFQGRPLKVNEAREREDRGPPRGGGGGGGFGGGGGGGYQGGGGGRGGPRKFDRGDRGGGGGRDRRDRRF